ncbi:MAG: hypothetical protein RLP09_50310 [Sandaracinaceae bacterium]|nr:hypothetical protein [Myxococcales bacterium]
MRPLRAEQLLAEARALEAQGALEDAAARLTAAARAPSHAARALDHRGRIERRLQRPRRAAATFRAALHHTLEDPARTLALYEELAACYRDLGQPSEAGYYLRRALRLAPHRDDLRQLHDQTISISERFEAVTQREIWLPPVEKEDLPTQGSDDPPGEPMSSKSAGFQAQTDG